MNLSTTPALKTGDTTSRLTASLSTLSLGLIILFAVGFVQGANDVIHDAAHDTRHTLVFPCH
ncbi:hypothetical protein MNBD_GAMMA20-2492 [hydrothermal vent metagenome]|uniref:Uncharacterized protein n=1 Tax=hydrothermal vent metagenome TaxID=652676 RepID=A0A3B1AGV1_9ZZZZ